MTRLPTLLRPLFPLAKDGVVLATRLAAPFTRRLTGSVGRPGPPRRAALSTAEYARQHPDVGVEIVPLAEGMVLDRPLPVGLPAGHPEFATHASEPVGPTFVARIPGGRIVDHFGAVVTPDDTLLFDLSPYWSAQRPSQHPIYLRRRLPAVEHVAGSISVLTTRASDNYYHFLTDVLPRLELLRQAGIESTRYVVNRRTRFQREMLDHLGIDEAQCIESALAPHLQADELVVPSVPDPDLKTPPWIVPWLRGAFLPDALAAPHRRLYVSRGSAKYTRRVDNEQALMATLAPLGFVAVDPGTLTVAEQVRAFAEAEVVIGAHGAGLTNIAFCPPSAAVIELFPRNYVNVCYWAMAATVEGLQYRYLAGDGRPTGVGSNRAVAADINAEITQVVRLLDELGLH